MPNAFDQVLTSIIHRATAEVADAVRASMESEIAAAMKARGPAKPPTPRKAAPPARKQAAKGAARSGRGGAAIDAGHAAQVLALLEKTPGLRAEEVTKRLGAKAEAVKAVLAALRTAGKVKTSGKARGTKYRVA